MSLRMIPNVTVLRPADANETAYAWRIALENGTGPTLLALTRQSLPTLDRTQYGSAEGTLKGAYVVKEAEAPIQAILMATGSEVEIALTAAETLEVEGVGARVVSMPSWELFEKQDAAYRGVCLAQVGDGARVDRGGRDDGLVALHRRRGRVDWTGPLRRVGSLREACMRSSALRPKRLSLRCAR